MKKNSIIIAMFGLLFCACEKEFVPEDINTDPQIVVEGYIEASTANAPPYVILTRSIPFFNSLNAEQLNDLFVHDALVTINDGAQSVTLTELCWDDIPEEFREQAGQIFGLDPDSVSINFCVYTDLTFSFTGQIGKTYDLNVQVEGKTITAQTTIPPHVPIDTLEFQVPPGNSPIDSLARCMATITDRPIEPDYYRFAVSINGGPFLQNTSTVNDDAFFNGQVAKFILPKPEDFNGGFDPDTFGYFVRGDSINVRWSNCDKATFDFWNTSEISRQRQGPFSTYVRITSNIKGGLGVFGGYSVSYRNALVPE